MHKIIYIDEHPDDIDRFLDYIEDQNLSELLKVVAIPPEPSLQECVEKIIDEKADAVVADFQLNEFRISINYNVPYNGTELVDELLKKREGFPCFVITSYDDDAIKASSDVNFVYEKSIFSGSEEYAKASFAERIIQQIEHYKARIDNAEKEFNQLLAKAKKGELDAVEESRLRYLDGFLERALSNHTAIPDSMKDDSFKSDLHKLIKSTDLLLEELNEQQK